MSLKPPKKSDLDKSWMKPRMDRQKKIQPEYHLIITEGTSTEPAYFGAMKEIINGYKHVWVVFDTDDFPADHINKTDQLCLEESTEDTIYHAVWSNQCMELWYLLHFRFMQSDLHRSEYWPKLTEILKSQGLGEYSKNRDDMYEILFPYMETAIAHAQKLDIINEGKLPSNSAPGTKVHELVLKLKPYLNN